MQIFRGIWPALVTPSNADHTVNVDVLSELVAYLLDKGIDGFYVGGTTGEGVFMPVAQRKLLVERVMADINGRVPVIVHVGAISLDDAVDMARHAQEQGAVGFSSIIPPMYGSIDLVARYYHELAAAVPDMIFMPYILNPDIEPLPLMQRLLDIPNLGGTKYTGPNMFEFRQILDLGGDKWTMFSGMDEQCLYAAMMGATGAIGSTLNFMPGVYRQIHDCVRSGEYEAAQALQIRANKVTDVMSRIGFQGALKEVLTKLLGKPVGDPRLPRIPLTDAQRDQLHQELAETDFDALVAM